MLIFDSFYSGPLRGVLSSLRRQNILQDVQTLILDGLSVTSDVCHEIINDPSFNVRILSIREVKNLNQAKLRGSLQYACRSSRPSTSPRLKALYVFGHKDVHVLPSTPSVESGTASPTSISNGWNLKSHEALSSSLRWEDESWWFGKGQIVTRPISQDWVNCMAACQGLIAFDAMLCQGPRHRTSAAFGKPPMMTDNQPQVATHSIRGCETCGAAPEGLVAFESSLAHFLPLLTPPPLLSSSVMAATSPSVANPQPFLPRCMDCLRERYCASCNKWWCEMCYQLPGQGAQPEIGSFVVVGEDDAVTIAETMDLYSATPKLKVRNGICAKCSHTQTRSTRGGIPV